ESTLGAGTRALAHRGPDGMDTWMAADRRVGLGHTRLAITAPANGAQPVASEDGRVVAVVNGEIYGTGSSTSSGCGARDRHQLRAALERAGHEFRTDSD